MNPAARLIVPLLLAATALLCVAAPAGAGEYELLECDPLNRATAEAKFDRSNGGDYAFGKHCTDPSQGGVLQIRSITSAPRGHSGAIRWLAATDTQLTGVSLQAGLRRDSGHRARLGFINASGAEAGRVGTGADEPGGLRNFSGRQTNGRAGFEAVLVCGDERCPQSDQARVEVRSVRLTLADDRAPAAALAGSLLEPGWVRGGRVLAIDATDRGSGVRRLTTTVGGKSVAPGGTLPCATIKGGPLAAAAQPCELSRSLEATLATTAAPFHNGANQLSVCVRDFGPDGNETCEKRSVNVDNLAPTAALRDPSKEDPELIRAGLGDRHSGVAAATISFQRAAGGSWRALPTRLDGSDTALARVDSSSVPRGRYRFRVEVADRAGNVTITTRRADRSELLLDFPLRERTRLRSRLAPGGKRYAYGSRPVVSGRLGGPVTKGSRSGKGRGLARESVEVVEHMEPGSRQATRVRRARTDARGRFRVRLAPGPSRRVEVRYAGSRRYLPASAGRRKVAVLGSARLKLNRKRVRAGKRVRFRGFVGRAGARIPARGKVVELQVRERGSKRFRTVRQALHTDANGRVRTSYSFDRFYARPALFEFRLRVTPQALWPYRAPTHSKPRRLRVIPR